MCPRCASLHQRECVNHRISKGAGSRLGYGVEIEYWRVLMPMEARDIQLEEVGPTKEDAIWTLGWFGDDELGQEHGFAPADNTLAWPGVEPAARPVTSGTKGQLLEVDAKRFDCLKWDKRAIRPGVHESWILQSPAADLEREPDDGAIDWLTVGSVSDVLGRKPRQPPALSSSRSSRNGYPGSGKFSASRCPPRGLPGRQRWTCRGSQ